MWSRREACRIAWGSNKSSVRRLRLAELSQAARERHGQEAAADAIAAAFSVLSVWAKKIGDYLENRAKERLFGSFAPLVPRVVDKFDGPRSLKLFKEDGAQFLRIYQEICGLRPSEKMLHESHAPPSKWGTPLKSP
jgi:hypothetical protein